MSKKTKRQKTKKTKLYQSVKTIIAKAKKDSKKGLPSLKETEAYIKEHNLKVIDPLSDFGFKRLLASERNKDILIHLLNAFISHDTGVITDITYLPTELLGIHKEDKYVRFDLFCENQDGDRFIVEMQNGRQLHYADRLRVYTSLATVQNLKHGDNEYRHVPRVYSFNMMSVNLLEFDGRNCLLYMFTHVVYMPEREVRSLTPMQQRFYEECQITNFTDMEKQGYVKSLMEHEDVREMSR